MGTLADFARGINANRRTIGAYLQRPETLRTVGAVARGIQTAAKMANAASGGALAKGIMVAAPEAYAAMKVANMGLNNAEKITAGIGKVLSI
jgi:hypothetical protein